VTGLLLAPQGIGSLLPRGIAANLTDRIGPRPVVITGLLLTALGTLAFTQAGPATSPWLLAGSLFIRGAGLAPVTIAVMAGAFQGVPREDVPDASSTTRIVQQVGGSFGAAVLASSSPTSSVTHPPPPPQAAWPSTRPSGGQSASACWRWFPPCYFPAPWPRPPSPRTQARTPPAPPRPTTEPTVIADLDTLLIALYVELTDRIIPTLRPRRGPGRPPTVTDAEVVCLAVAQVLLRYNDEHHWLRAAPARVGHLFPGCCPNPNTTGGCAAAPTRWRSPCAGWPSAISASCIRR